MDDVFLLGLKAAVDTYAGFCDPHTNDLNHETI